MSQSTPISQLPIPMREEEDPQKMGYIQQIMDEIHEADQQQQQQPSQVYDRNNNTDDDNDDAVVEFMNDDDDDKNNDNFTDYLWNELREPILFMVFFVLFNIPPIVYVLSKYIPWMINSQTGAATYTGLMVRGSIAGLLYWLLKHYIIG